VEAEHLSAEADVGHYIAALPRPNALSSSPTELPYLPHNNPTMWASLGWLPWLSGAGFSGSGLHTALGRVLLPSLGARPMLSVLCALRGTSGGASMTTPGGPDTPLRAQLRLFPCSAHRLLS
jgi:hypothetical protein